jgi:hypothetical protein
VSAQQAPRLTSRQRSVFTALSGTWLVWCLALLAWAAVPPYGWENLVGVLVGVYGLARGSCILLDLWAPLRLLLIRRWYWRRREPALQLVRRLRGDGSRGVHRKGRGL